MITDAKILVTGVSGTIGSLLASRLAAENDVWGVARFDDPSARAALDDAGVTTRVVDLDGASLADELAALPRDFTHLLHLAWMRAGLDELDAALRTNVEAAGLMLQHCSRARSTLVMSGMSVYSPHEDPWHLYAESDPVGRAATAYAPTSPACKLGLEAVVRTCARAFAMPVVIARLNTFMGPPSSFPGMHIDAVLDGRSMVAPHDPNPHSPIHIDDMHDQLEALLDAASVPALVTNWCGDEVVTAQDWVQRAAHLSGLPGRIDLLDAPGTPPGTAADPTRRRALTGPCRTDIAGAFDQLYREMTTTEESP